VLAVGYVEIEREGTDEDEDATDTDGATDN